MRKTGEKKYQDASDQTYFAFDLQATLNHALLIHAHNS
jgi:hypothetical protein